MSCAPHPAVQSIPLICRIQRFVVRSWIDIARVNNVHTSWSDACQNYATIPFDTIVQHTSSGDFEKCLRILSDDLGFEWMLRGLLLLAAVNRDERLIKIIRDFRCGPNGAVEERTLLHQSCYYRGHEFVAKLLIDEPISLNVNARMTNGQTPAHVAAQQLSIGVVRVLVVNGADLRARDENGYVPYEIFMKLMLLRRSLSGGANFENDRDLSVMAELLRPKT